MNRSIVLGCISFSLCILFLGLGSAAAKTQYMDAQLGSNCTSGNYNIDSRRCGGSDGNAYNTLQSAIDASKPGDTILVRGGTWSEGGIDIRDPKKTANLTIKAYKNESPIIDNNDKTGKPGDYAKVILIQDTSGVTIEGLEIREWSVGIFVADAENITIRNNKIHDTWLYCLVVHRSPNTIIEDNDIYRGIWRKELTGRNGGGIVAFHYGCEGSIIRRNKIHDSFWEGMNIGRGTDDILIEKNIIYGNRQLQLYLLNNRNVVARYNLIYGTEGSNPKRGGYGPGIWMSMESHEEASSDYYNGHHKIYGNLVANTSCNLWVTAQRNSAGIAYPIINTQVYNNTFIGGRSCNVRYRAQIGFGHVFKNNIIWANGKGAITIEAPAEKIDADYNLWSETPHAAFKGKNDCAYGVPQFKKMTGWSNLKGDELNGSEFAIVDDFRCAKDGVALNQIFKQLIDVRRSNWKTKQFYLVDETKNGSGWSIGASVLNTSVVDEVIELDPPILRIIPTT